MIVHLLSKMGGSGNPDFRFFSSAVWICLVYFMFYLFLINYSVHLTNGRVISIIFVCFCFSCFRTTLLQYMILLQYDCGNELCQKITIKFFFFLKTFDFFHQLSVFCIIIQCFNFYLYHILYIRTVYILTVQRVENSLSGFSSESLVFCERKSEIVICCFPQKNRSRRS